MTAKVQRMIHEIAPSPPKTPEPEYEPEPEVMQEDGTGSQASQEVQDSLELGAEEGHDPLPDDGSEPRPDAMEDVD